MCGGHLHITCQISPGFWVPKIIKSGLYFWLNNSKKVSLFETRCICKCMSFPATLRCFWVSIRQLKLQVNVRFQIHVYLSINQSCIFRVVQVIKSLQDPLEVGNNLPGINDNVRERGLEPKCFKRWRYISRFMEVERFQRAKLTISLEVTGTDASQSAIYVFLLVFLLDLHMSLSCSVFEKLIIRLS